MIFSLRSLGSNLIKMMILKVLLEEEILSLLCLEEWEDKVVEDKEDLGLCSIWEEVEEAVCLEVWVECPVEWVVCSEVAEEEGVLILVNYSVKWEEWVEWAVWEEWVVWEDKEAVERRKEDDSSDITIIILKINLKPFSEYKLNKFLTEIIYMSK